MHHRLLTDVVEVLLEVAADEVMPRWRNLGAGDVAEKSGPDDIVTVADRETERVLSGRLAALLPGATVVGEEAVAADASIIDRLRGSGPVWVIDPIDGTSAFAAGEPEFALMVALVSGGRPVAGWIVAPALGEVTYGGAEWGVWQGVDDQAPSPLSRGNVPARLAEMNGLLGRRNITPARRAELQAKEALFKSLGAVTCAGIDYARLARSEAHFALYSKSEPWDHLPGLGILAGLGFHAGKHDGSPYRPGDNTGGLLIAPDEASFARIKAALIG